MPRITEKEEKGMTKKTIENKRDNRQIGLLM
jgi:hypothetical protein